MTARKSGFEFPQLHASAGQRHITMAEEWPLTSCTKASTRLWILTSSPEVPQLSPALRVPAIGSNAETARPGSKMGSKPGASRRSACPPRPPCLKPKLPGTHTASPRDTGAQRGGQLGQAIQRMPAARGHDHRPVHLRVPLRYPGPRDQRRGATGAPGLQRRAVRDHRQRGRPRGGSGYPPGQVAGPSASRRSPGSPLPPGPPDEPSAPPRPGRADGYLSRSAVHRVVVAWS
jgi:hypothetical protein